MKSVLCQSVDGKVKTSEDVVDGESEEVRIWLQNRNLFHDCVAWVSLSLQNQYIVHLNPEVSLKHILRSYHLSKSPVINFPFCSSLFDLEDTTSFRISFYAYVLRNFLHEVKWNNWRITTFKDGVYDMFAENTDVNTANSDGSVSSNFVLCDDRNLVKCRNFLVGENNASSSIESYIVVGHPEKLRPFSDFLSNVSESLEECYYGKHETLDKANLKTLTQSIIQLEMLKASHHKGLNLNWTSSVSKTEACFIMYNASRLQCILKDFDQKVKTGYYSALPEIEHLDLSDIIYVEEWSLIQRLVLEFNPTFQRIAEILRARSASDEVKFPIHLLFVYLSKLVRGLSVYYSKHKVLLMPQNDLVQRTVHLRIHVIKLVFSVLEQGLKLAGCQILDRM